MIDPDLQALAYECVLKQANSSSPAEVLADYFQQAYNAGVSAGLKRSQPKADEEGGS